MDITTKIFEFIDYISSFIIDFFKLVAYGLFVSLNLEKEPFGILIALICLDSLVGAIRSVSAGNQFKFSVLLWGFCLKMCFIVIPLAVTLMGKSLGRDFSVTVSITVSVLSVSEVYSILGNIYSAKYKEDLKKIDFVSILIKTARDTIEKSFIKMVKAIESRGGCDMER